MAAGGATTQHHGNPRRRRGRVSDTALSARSRLDPVTPGTGRALKRPTKDPMTNVGWGCDRRPPGAVQVPDSVACPGMHDNNHPDPGPLLGGTEWRTSLPVPRPRPNRMMGGERGGEKVNSCRRGVTLTSSDEMETLRRKRWNYARRYAHQPDAVEAWSKTRRIILFTLRLVSSGSRSPRHADRTRIEGRRI